MGVPGVVCIDWTKARVDQLKTLWAAGLSSGQIGIEMGVTRNTIIGKVQRLKLPGRATLVRKPQGPSMPTSLTPREDAGMMRRIAKKAAPRAANDPHKFEAEIAVDLPPDQSPDAVAFLERKPKQCAWPLGFPAADMLVCGSPRDGEHSYCKRHHRLSVQACRPRTIELTEADRAKRVLQARKNLAAHKERMAHA